MYRNNYHQIRTRKYNFWQCESFEFLFYKQKRYLQIVVHLFFVVSSICKTVYLVIFYYRVKSQFTPIKLFGKIEEIVYFILVFKLFNKIE